MKSNRVVQTTPRATKRGAGRRSTRHPPAERQQDQGDRCQFPERPHPTPPIDHQRCCWGASKQQQQQVPRGGCTSARTSPGPPGLHPWLKAAQRLLCCLMKLHLASAPLPTRTTFFLTVWAGSWPDYSRRTLQSTSNTAGRIICAPLPSPRPASSAKEPQ